jgi:hypothetical protein
MVSHERIKGFLFHCILSILLVFCMDMLTLVYYRYIKGTVYDLLFMRVIRGIYHSIRYKTRKQFETDWGKLKDTAACRAVAMQRPREGRM